MNISYKLQCLIPNLTNFTETSKNRTKYFILARIKNKKTFRRLIVKSAIFTSIRYAFK